MQELFAQAETFIRELIDGPYGNYILAAVIVLPVAIFFLWIVSAFIEWFRKPTAGWAIPAKRRKPRSKDRPETLILRPAFRRSFLTLFCFVFYWLLSSLALIELRRTKIPAIETLSLPMSPEIALTWLIALISGFLALALGLRLVFNMRRLEISGNTMTYRRPLIWPRRFDLGEVYSLQPMKKRKRFAFGAKIQFENGRKFRIPASFEGYQDLLDHLAKSFPLVKKALRQNPLARKKSDA